MINPQEDHAFQSGYDPESGEYQWDSLIRSAHNERGQSLLNHDTTPKATHCAYCKKLLAGKSTDDICDCAPF